MASYKVPQDVEADDKLIGPFSFRQFIYLIIVVASGAIAWVLGNLFLPLGVIPLPFILFFGALALPLRKDQPMETYLAAIVSFYLKPRRRLWDPDGQQALIQIVAPKTDDKPITKGLSQEEADKRFAYLAGVVDSRGWAVRGVDGTPNSSMNTDVYYEAQQAEDVLDDNARTSRYFDSQIDRSNAAHRQQLIAQLQQPTPPQTTPTPTQPPVAQQPQLQAVPEPHLTFNPYPTMQQSVIQPTGMSAQTPNPTPTQAQDQESASEKQPSPDIISLANNPDLSIETIAHEANRIKSRELPENEVVISLH
jgi:hypothetical protein